MECDNKDFDLVIQASEFSCEIDIQDMRMDLGVFVAYKWNGWTRQKSRSDGDEVDKIDNDDHDRNTDEQGSEDGKDGNSDEDGVCLPYIINAHSHF